MDPVTVDVADVPGRFEELLALAAAGTPVVITRDGRSRGRLVADPAAAGRRVAGRYAGKMWMADDFDAPLPDEFWLGGT